MNDIIETAARELIDVSPSAGFHEGVLARLDRRPRIHWRPLAAGLGVAIAASLAAVFVLTPSMDMPGVHPIAARVTAEPDVRPTANAPVQIAKTSQPRPTGVSASEAAWLARAIPALPVPPSLTPEAIQPSGSSIAPISVEPFEPRPIEIAPLDFRTNGGR